MPLKDLRRKLETAAGDPLMVQEITPQNADRYLPEGLRPVYAKVRKADPKADWGLQRGMLVWNGPEGGSVEHTFKAIQKISRVALKKVNSVEKRGAVITEYEATFGSHPVSLTTIGEKGEEIDTIRIYGKRNA